MDNLIFLAITLLSILGFYVALRISVEKKKQKPMVCPLNMRCEQVLYSRYARFLGIPLEYLGMLYYCLVAVSFFVFLYYPNSQSTLFVLAIFLLTTGGFIFSAYLLTVQAFKLREWCSWCLTSSALSATIFLLASRTEVVSNAFTALTDTYKIAIVISYVLTAAIGLSAAVLAEIFLSRFLQDFSYSEEEEGTIHTIRQIVWLTIIATAIFSYFLYLSGIFTGNTDFKMPIRLGVLIILALTNMLYDSLISYPLKPEAQYLRKLQVFLAPLSIISWSLIIFIEMLLI